jgi:ABC-type branched-subunit amino acid transport system substrate-binding protein
VSVFPFFSGITLPESKQFVSAYKKKYRDALPGAPDGNGYVIGMVIDTALKAAKGNIADKTEFCKVLSNVKLDKTPRGPIRFDANGQVICNVYVGRVEKVGDRVENVFVDVIPDTRQ